MNAVEHISWEAAEFSKVHKNLGRILDKLQLRGLHTCFLPDFLRAYPEKNKEASSQALTYTAKTNRDKTQRDRRLFCGQPDRNIACAPA